MCTAGVEAQCTLRDTTIIGLKRRCGVGTAGVEAMAEVEAMCTVRNTTLIGLNRYCRVGSTVETSVVCPPP